jgi:hypothetical protein
VGLAHFLVLSILSRFHMASFTALFSGALPLNEAQIDYFASLSEFDYAITVAIYVTHMAGTVFLFRVRKAAVTVFAVALTMNLLVTAQHVLTRNYAAALGGSGVAGYTLGIGLLIGVILYARRLQRQGVLT